MKNCMKIVLVTNRNFSTVYEFYQGTFLIFLLSIFHVNKKPRGKKWRRLIKRRRPTKDIEGRYDWDGQKDRDEQKEKQENVKAETKSTKKRSELPTCMLELASDSLYTKTEIIKRY